MIKPLFTHALAWMGLLLLTLAACRSPEAHQQALYEAHCGSCHQPPDPAVLPKHIWEQRVLPEMGARLGIRTPGYDALAAYSWQEQTLIQQLSTYPVSPVLSEQAWQSIRDYVLQRAPERLAGHPEHPAPGALTQFRPRPITLDGREGASLSYLGWEADSQAFLAGNVAGYLLRWRPEQLDTICQGTSTVVDWHGHGNDGILTQIGILPPSEIPQGKLLAFEQGQYRERKTHLHRPVYTQVSDLNGDETTEYLVCEYGNLGGQLSLLQPQPDGSFSRRGIFGLPGTIQVIPDDLNDDGRTDLVVLAAQGREGVYALYQEEDLTFEITQWLSFPASAGSSWMEYVDVNQDGHRDLIVAQGDNADYSPIAKPYHGVRIYLNDGEYHFAEAYFYPCYGATRVVARDFDRDGDMDLAVCAYFPEFDSNPQESFVYLEQTAHQPLSFAAYTTPAALEGRWIVAEAGDYDGDGDEDLMLGSFTHTPTPVPDTLMQRWRSSGTDLLLLENVAVDSEQSATMAQTP